MIHDPQGGAVTPHLVLLIAALQLRQSERDEAQTLLATTKPPLRKEETDPTPD